LPSVPTSRANARHLGREHRELLDHRVDDVRRAQELALQRPPADFELDRLQKVAARDRGDRVRHRGRRPQADRRSGC
jgi:hypothetical protein